MNATDWALLAVLLLSALLGLWRGLVYEVLSVAGWVAAFVLAQAYAADAGGLLPLDGFSQPLRLVAGFVAVFVATAFVAGLLAWGVKHLVASVGLRPVDRVLGGAFGLLRGAVMLLALALVVGMTPLHSQAWWRESAVAAVLDSAVQTLRPLLPQSLARQLP